MASRFQTQRLFPSTISLRVALERQYPKSGTSLSHVWRHIFSFSEVRTLTLTDSDHSHFMAGSLQLFELASLTRLTSLWLQEGHAAPKHRVPAITDRSVQSEDKHNLQCGMLHT